jgi:TolB-like protein
LLPPRKGHNRTQPGIIGHFTGFHTVEIFLGALVGQSAANNPDRRLDSWKEIAAFFGRDERTVRRWEKESALPVHRVPGGAKGRVFAYESELEAWLSTPQAHETATSVPEPDLLDLPTGEVQRGRKPFDVRAAAKLAGALALCAALATGIFFYRKSRRFAAYASAPNASLVNNKDPQSTLTASHAPNLDPDSVAVLPFTNAGRNANTDYLSDGVTESLIGNLAHLPQLKVRSRDSVFRYKGKDIDIQTAGSNLRVSVLVSGRVLVQGDTIAISAELTDIRDNTEIWGRRYEGKRADIILLQQRMAGDIAGKLRSTLSPADKQQVTNQGTQDAEAYSLYLKARYAWNNRTYSEVTKAIAYFNQAIAKDPGYALAYSGLADAYSVLPNYGGNQNEDFPKSNGAARKALELDPTLAHPHAVLGSNEMQYDWDFAGGEAEFRKSFELDPNDATARQWYADDIAMIGGREQEAIAQVNLAHELDPQSPVISRVVGSVLVWTRHFDEAIAICTKLATDDPAFAIAQDCLSQAYWGKRMYPQVIEESKAYAELSGYRVDAEFAAAIAEGYRSAGWKGALIKAIEFRQAQRKNGYYSALIIATFYADLGDKEQAFHWLSIAYQEHDWLLISLNTNFRFDSLRPDPRYAELVRNVGLPQSEQAHR